MNKLAIATISMLAILAANSVFASDIYKWTDAEGNVHYGDKPTVGDQSERLAIVSQPTNPALIQAAAQARVDSRAARSEASAADEGPSADDLEAQAAERTARCATVKAQMQQLVTSRRLYREDDDGERVYLDESETLEARERVENQITEYCE